MASFADDFQNVRRLPIRRFSLGVTHVGIDHRMAAIKERSPNQTMKEARPGSFFRETLEGPSTLGMRHIYLVWHNKARSDAV